MFRWIWPLSVDATVCLKFALFSLPVRADRFTIQVNYTQIVLMGHRKGDSKRLRESPRRSRDG